MVSCILLAAGLSSRFSSPKALAKFGEITVIEQLQGLLVDTQLFEIIIVLGARADDIKPFLLKHKKIKVVYNKDYNLGQTSSFKVGLESVSPAGQGVMMLPVDYPFLKKETIDSIFEKFMSYPSPIFMIPTYQGKKGHPPIFHAAFKEEFQVLDNALGLNTVASHHLDKTVLLPVDDLGVISTFNTQEEFLNLKKIFGRS